MLQLHPSDQQFNCLLKCGLYWRIDGRFLWTTKASMNKRVVISFDETAGLLSFAQGVHRAIFFSHTRDAHPCYQYNRHFPRCQYYHQTSSINRIKSKNLIVSRLVLQLSWDVNSGLSMIVIRNVISVKFSARCSRSVGLLKFRSLNTAFGEIVMV